jgi:uncharacterized membrane protein YfhO
MITLKTARELSNNQNQLESLIRILDDIKENPNCTYSLSMNGRLNINGLIHNDHYLSVSLSKKSAEHIFETMANEKIAELEILNKQAKIELGNGN